MTKFGEKFNHAGTLLVGWIGFIGILVATLGVITRFVLKISIAWSDELLRTTFIWGYFIGAALCYHEGGIMRLEIVESTLARRGKKVAKKTLKLICEVINLIFFGVSTYYVYVICMQHAARGTTSSTSKVPAWVLPLSYGVGCGLIAIFALINLFRLIRKDPDIPQEATTEQSSD